MIILGLPNCISAGIKLDLSKNIVLALFITASFVIFKDTGSSFNNLYLHIGFMVKQKAWLENRPHKGGLW